jgi:Helix-turn-helix domain
MADSSPGPAALRLRALAHPLRWKLFDIVFREGTATATRCAELTGESVASCSYHLNILGKYGYIEQVPGAGKEKPWRSIDARQELSAPGPELEDRLAAEAATEAFLEHEFDRLRAWQRLRDTEPSQWRNATGLGGSTMWSPPRNCSRSTTRSGRSSAATPNGPTIRRCVLPARGPPGCSSGPP